MLLGLTGGIATGKSTFVRLLAESADFAVFDADAHVHELLSSDPEVIADVIRAFALPSGPNQPIDRSALRKIVFHDPSARRRLEEILHPRVRAEWTRLLEGCRGTNRNLLADIPLLFETGAAPYFEVTVLVAASPATQRKRLLERRLAPDIIEGMLASQWPIGQKLPLADHVVWNDGSMAELEEQSALLLDLLFAFAA